MYKYVLSMILFGGIIGGGLLGGGLIVGGCGEDTAPGGGNGGAAEGEGEGSAEGEGDTGEGEGDGSPNEGEGEDPLPPGGDLEPCGGASRNECQDGYECMTCDEGNVESVPDERSPGDTKPCEGRICTCPQWFEGAWWAEFTDVHAVDYEYDFTVGNVDAEFWSSGEIELTQEGCAIKGPRGNYAIGHQDHPDERGKFTPPGDFLYKTGRGAWDRDEMRWVTFTGVLSPDHRTVSGTCDGWYSDGSVEPSVFFRVECSFTLTRR